LPTAHYLPYRATRRFSPLVLDYLAGADALSPFYNYSPDAAGLAKAIEARRRHPVDRSALVKVLQGQYEHLPPEQKATDHIALLAAETTFTICTAHQPNLATGYLYFVYKILHAIRLAQEMNAAYPEYRFVPVYYIGSEDADLDELGTFRYGDRKFVWNAGGQTGAVGRMNTATLAPLLDELYALLGPPGPARDELENLLRQSYSSHHTIAQATQYLVHGLFGRYGLVVIDPDDAALKRAFIPVMEEDLTAHTAERLVGQSIRALGACHYKAQAHPRPINLFYLKDDTRERIERNGDEWRVLNTGIVWDKANLIAELHEHPERFSPNVMLRPLYQETILPDIAFVGGGAETAYWLQLQSLFAHHEVFYPAILLRQSVMWMNAQHAALREKTRLDLPALFAPAHEAAESYVAAHSDREWHTAAEAEALDGITRKLAEKAAAVDPTLSRSAEAAVKKMKYQLEVLEQKMLRAEKRRLHTGLERLARLQASLFPGGGLAERVENFMPYYLEYGPAFFDELLAAMEPLRNEFLVMEEQS
jgi:bacillithiol biosynthesis cysteine-adding enzyme BshC